MEKFNRFLAKHFILIYVICSVLWIALYYWTVDYLKVLSLILMCCSILLTARFLGSRWMVLLKKPMEIADPILNPGHSREYSLDTCIYGALIKSIEACMVLTEQKNVLNGIVSEQQKARTLLDAIIKEQTEIRIRDRELMAIILEIRKPWWKKVFR